MRVISRILEALMHLGSYFTRLLARSTAAVRYAMVTCPTHRDGVRWRGWWRIGRMGLGLEFEHMTSNKGDISGKREVELYIETQHKQWDREGRIHACIMYEFMSHC